MKNNFSFNIANVTYAFFLLAMFLLPLIALPFTNDFLGHSKIFFLFAIAIISLISYFLQAIKKRSWTLVLSPITIPVLFFAIISLASSFFTNLYPVKALLGMGGVYLASSIIILIGGSLFTPSKKTTDHLINSLILSAVVLGITQLLQLLGFGPSRLINQLFNLDLPNNLIFNLAGSSFVAGQIILVALVGAVSQIFKNKQISNLHIVGIPLLLFGLGLSVWSVLPGKETSIILPPFSANWSVLLDSIRSPRAALIGQGPENYIYTYARLRPLWVNGQDYWQSNFAVGPNFPMTLVVSMGFLGLIAWLLVFLKFVNKNTIKNAKNDPIFAMIIAIFLLQLFMPTNVIMLGLQAILLAFWSALQAYNFPVLKLEALSMTISIQKNLQQLEKKPSNWLITLVNVIFLGGVFYLSFLVGKAYASFYRLQQANIALANNDAVGVYDNQRIARELNPYIDSIQSSYAFTNMQIALALSEKTDITDEEKEQASILIQQALDSARNATVLEPNNSQNWLILAQIYRNLIGSIEGADQWTVNSFVRAIESNPNDPFLRIELAILLANQNQVQEAGNILQQAIEIKPDIPTGYYQLAQLFVANNNYLQAQQLLQRTLSLLPVDSDDYIAVSKQLEEVEPLAKQQEKELNEQQQLNANGGDLNNQQGADQSSTIPTKLNSLTEQSIQNPADTLRQEEQTQLQLNENIPLSQ